MSKELIEEKNCQCYDHRHTFPKIKEIRKKLTRDEFAIIDELLDRLFNVETDAVYWKMKYKDKWDTGYKQYSLDTMDKIVKILNDFEFLNVGKAIDRIQEIKHLLGYNNS